MAANIPVPKPQKPFEALKATLSPKSTANTNTAKSNLSRPNEMFTSFTKLPAILSKPNTQRSPQDVKNILNSIRNLELFKTHMKQIDDNDEFLMTIYESLNYEVVNQYDAVFHYGDPSDKLHIILQGNVDIYVPKTSEEINIESAAKQGPKKSLSQDSDQQKGILKTEKSNMILKPWSPLENDGIPKKSIAFKLDKSEPANSSSRKKSTTRNSQITSNVPQAIDIFSKFEDQLWLYINNGICTFKKSIAYGPGICLGEVNVSADAQKDTTAIATSQVHLMSITKAAYEKAIQTKVIDLAVSSYRLPGNNNISGVTHKRETSITKTIEQSSIEPKTLITENDHNFDTSPKEQTPNRISSHRKSKTMTVTMQAQTVVTSEEAETPSSKPLRLSLKMRTSMPEKAESGTNTVKTITESANALHKLFNDKILPSKSSPLGSNQFKSSYRMQVSNLNTSKKNTNTHASMNSSIKLDPVYPPDPRKELHSRTYQSTEERLDSQGFPLPKKNGFTPYGSGDLDFPQFLTIKSHIFPVDDRRKPKPRAKFPHLKVQPQKEVVLPPKDYSRDEEVSSYFNLASMELSSPFAKKSVSLSLSLNTFTPYNPRVMRNDVRLDNLWAVSAQMQDIEEEGVEKGFQPFQNNKPLVMSKHNLFRGKPGRAHLAPNYNLTTLGDRPFGKSTISTMY